MFPIVMRAIDTVHWAYVKGPNVEGVKPLKIHPKLFKGSQSSEVNLENNVKMVMGIQPLGSLAVCTKFTYFVMHLKLKKASGGSNGSSSNVKW